MSDFLQPHGLSGSSVHGVFQARILEWVAISLSRGSSRPRDQTCVSCIGRQILYQWAAREDPGGLYSAYHGDSIKDLAMGRVSRVIQVGPNMITRVLTREKPAGQKQRKEVTFLWR